MRGVEIRPLTGLRMAAALWVVVFHVVAGRPANFHEELPAVGEWFGPLIGSGRLGVDLFFVLSGFVLALNYLDTMGHDPNLGSMRRFWWARLSRVWPAYFVMISVAALVDLFAAVILQRRHLPEGLTPLSYLEQMLLVQQWTSERHAGTSWNGPSWSVSAEALAYLLFPLLALLVARLARISSARVLFALSLVSMAPLLLVMVSSDGYGSSYSWVLRILCEFVAGMLAYTAVAAVRWTPGRRRAAGWAAALLGVTLVAALYAAPYAPIDSAWGLTCILFVPLIGLLAVASGPLAGFLSTGPMVLGGRISYSLYLVHIPTFHLFLALARQLQVVQDNRALNVYISIALVPVAFGFAWLLWRYVEEPGRRRMRDMADRPTTTVAPSSETAQPVRVG